MSTTLDVLTGMATRLDAAGLCTYSPSGLYTSGQTGWFFKSTPADPDRVIVGTCYTLANLPDGPLDQVNLQLWFRGIPSDDLDVDVLGDSVFDNLHGSRDYPLGAVFVIQCLQKSSLPMGVDSAGRWERSDNYTLDVTVPATANRPL